MEGTPFLSTSTNLKLNEEEIDNIKDDILYLRKIVQSCTEAIRTRELPESQLPERNPINTHSLQKKRLRSPKNTDLQKTHFYLMERLVKYSEEIEIDPTSYQSRIQDLLRKAKGSSNIRTYFIIGRILQNVKLKARRNKVKMDEFINLLEKLKIKKPYANSLIRTAKLVEKYPKLKRLGMNIGEFLRRYTEIEKVCENYAFWSLA